MLDAYALESVPDSDRLANAEPAGPCSYYVGSDSWTTTACLDGVVLAGDAAGWSDPVIGEGLSIALRDAALGRRDHAGERRLVGRGVRALRRRTDRADASAADRRLRGHGDALHVHAEARLRRAAFGERMMADPMILNLMLSTVAGPETAPAECFTDANVEHVLAG